MVSGAMKSTAASTQSVSDPGPACAAAGIQRVAVTQVMANSVRSRSPSSRFRWGGPSASAAGCAAMLIQFPPQFLADAAQAFRQELGLAAQPDAQVTFQA